MAKNGYFPSDINKSEPGGKIQQYENKRIKRDLTAKLHFFGGLCRLFDWLKMIEN